jgi:hypothetical protein
LERGPGCGADQTGTPRFFVVTHSPPRDVRLERELGMRFIFVPDLVTVIDRRGAEQGRARQLAADEYDLASVRDGSATRCSAISLSLMAVSR